MIFKSALVFTFLSIVFVENSYAQKTDSVVSLAAKSYFDQAFKVIKNGSYKKKQINFDELYKKALPYLQGAKVSKDTYEAIKYVISALNDKHSRFIYPQHNIANRQNAKKSTMPVSTLVYNDYAVLKLLSYSSLDQVQNRKVADSIYNFLRSLQKNGIKNLIIDLRNMEGGSNDPFLCGLAPIINKTELLTYIGSNGEVDKVTFEQGYLYHRNKRAKFGDLYLSNYAKDVVFTKLAVSILTGKYTASAGEIIAIAFKNLPNIKFVGEPTYGIPTGVALISLADGAAIGIASSLPKDRKGKTYESSLIPDFILKMEGLSDEAIYLKALDFK